MNPILLVGLLAAPALAQPPSAASRPTELVLEDQFDRKADLADLRGHVVIIVYGDRHSTDACRALGEALHVHWHPEAKGQPPAKARSAPVVPLDNLKPGQVAPDVIVVPVACCGKIPPAVRGLIRSHIAKGVPDAVVWLDFDDIMKTRFGQKPGEPNLVVFDTQGRLRAQVSGKPDAVTWDRLIRTVQALRAEGVR